MKDQDLAKIIKLLKDGKVNKDEAECAAMWSKRSKLCLREGLLYLLEDESHYRLLVPKDRQSLIKMTRESFAHIGVKKTFS